MPDTNAINQLPIATSGNESGRPEPLESPPVGYLTSRELFLHVLSLRWGERADDDKNTPEEERLARRECLTSALVGPNSRI